MYKLYQRKRLLYYLIDFIFISLSFYLPVKLNSPLIPQDHAAIGTYLGVFCFWGIVLVFILNNHNLYTTNRSLGISREAWLVAKCVASSSLLAALFIFVLKAIIFSRVIFVQNTILLMLTLGAWRAIKRAWVRYLIRSGYGNYNILIVGAGDAGLMLAEEISGNPYLGLKITGFLDDLKPGSASAAGAKILGKIENLEEVIRKEFIDEIYVSLPAEHKLAAEIIRKGKKLGKTVRILPDYLGLQNPTVKLNYLGSIPLMTYFEKNGNNGGNILKRLMDISVSTLLLFILFPFFFIIALLIKLDSRGKVFYVSQRCGEKGKIFNFYKFRSMVNDADNYKESLRSRSEVKGPIFKIKKDPRVTLLGRFLRKYSLDELPQLINVLKGDMSLVGPRPFPVEESKNLENRHLPRLNIKPGITGLAQIKGRSDLPFYQWAKLDLWYFNHWSLGLDLKILWWTIPAVLKGRGAY